MRDSGSPAPDNGTTREHPLDLKQLAELRGLLIGPERKQIDRLQERLDDPKIRANDMSQVLPEAITLRLSRDKQITKALEPTVEEALKRSVQRDPKSLGDALFPVMGPAIRKAISSAILGMIQSFNKALEYGFSLRGLKWRLEALRTRKPFAEVVLLHTLKYQVEQVFLILRNSGLVLQHVVAEEVAAQDPDLVSSMLTAIQDFVSDSFGVEKGEGLDTLRIGDRNVWIEQGPLAVLAAVIRGNPPEHLKLVFRETLDTIHIGQGVALESFEGDVTPFEAVRSDLEDCLQSESIEEKKKKTSPLLWGILGAIIFMIGIWAFYSMQDHRRWSTYMERLHSEPGIVVTGTEKRAGKIHLFGLRDPLASDPAMILKEANLDPEKAIFRWEPYHSLYPQFLLKRIKNLLRPPQTVTLRLEEDSLHAKGSAFHQWIVEARKLVKALFGAVQFREDHLVDIDLHLKVPETVSLRLEGRDLHASGSAPHHWIITARKKAKTIPNIIHYVDSEVGDTDLRDMETTMERIEEASLLFKFKSAALSVHEEPKLRALVRNLENLFRIAKVLNKKARIDIVGHTDSTGTEKKNMEISRERAEKLLTILVSEGLEADHFTAKGVGSKEPPREEVTDRDKELNRCVTFSVSIRGNRQ